MCCLKIVQQFKTIVKVSEVVANIEMCAYNFEDLMIVQIIVYQDNWTGYFFAHLDYEHMVAHKVHAAPDEISV